MRAQVHERIDALADLRPQWRALESRALEPNAYLSARFVLPALAHLPTTLPVWAVSVHEDASGAGPLRGLGLFQGRSPRRLFPLPHAQTYASPHSYLGGILLDRDQAGPALRALLDALSQRTSGLRLERRSAESPTARLLQEAVAARGGSWHEEAHHPRACISAEAGGPRRWRVHVPPARLRDCERQWRRLAERGRLSWHYLRGDEVDDRAVETFLAIEHAGWKGDEGTSLRSDPRHEAFFREMTCAFRADGDLFFTELRLDAEVIASTCNLRAGRDGFAFKVGFDPRYAKFGPGWLNEMGFLKALEQGVDDFRVIDSGAEPGSFIESLWPDRVVLHSGTIALGRVSRAVASAAKALSLARRRLQVPLAAPAARA